jgi:malate permease and related proteins
MDILTVLRSLGSVVVILLLVGLGVFVDRKKWFPGDSWKGLGSIVVNIAMPCSAFYYLTTGFTRADLASAGLSMLLYAAAIVVSFFISKLLAAAFRVPKGRRGVFTATAVFSNTVFIGVPMTQMLFGDAAVKYAFMAFLSNMTLFWTLGFFAIRRDADPDGPAFAKGWLWKILNPTLIATILALVFIFLGLRSPADPTKVTKAWDYLTYILTQVTKTAGYMVSPAALIYCGILLNSMGFQKLKVDGSHIVSMLLRFVLAPLLAFAALMLVPMPSLMMKVLIAQAAMPAMSQISIVAGLYKADAEYAATGFMLTTVASIVFIPAIMIVMEAFIH